MLEMVRNHLDRTGEMFLVHVECLNLSKLCTDTHIYVTSMSKYILFLHDYTVSSPDTTWSNYWCRTSRTICESSEK